MIFFDNGMDIDICGCNYTCVSCNHFAPFGKLPIMKPEEVEHDLRILGRFARMNRLSILGGEPTLSPYLVDILEIARHSRLGRVVELTTNGSLLHTLPEKFWLSFDVLYISLYRDKPIDDNIALAKQKSKKYGFEIKLKRHEFWKVLNKHPLSEPLAQQQYDTCVLRHICHATYHGYFYQCPASKILPGRFMGLTPTVDGIALDEHLTEESLRAYLERPSHFHSCALCSQQKEFTEWREVKTESEWLEGSTVDNG